MSNNIQIQAILLSFHINLENMDIESASTIAKKELNNLIWSNIHVSSGWTWAEACHLTDQGIDVREYDMANLIPKIESDLESV